MTNIDKDLYHRQSQTAVEVSGMIARIARFRYETPRHREEAERNGSERVGPALAREPGFQAIYYGRTAELEAVSLSLFDSREANEAAAAVMNAQPLLAGQVSKMLPTAMSVEFYDVLGSVVRDRVPAVGRLGYLTIQPDVAEARADRWGLEVFTPMLERMAGLCQAYLLRSTGRRERVAVTFWDSADAMRRNGAAIGSWQGSEAAAGREPPFVSSEPIVLTDLRVVVVGVSATMPAAV